MNTSTIETRFWPTDAATKEHGVVSVHRWLQPNEIGKMSNLLFPSRPKCSCGKEFTSMDEFIAHYLRTRPALELIKTSSRWKKIPLPNELQLHVAKHNLVNMVAKRNGIPA
jgi:hypothetical protein